MKTEKEIKKRIYVLEMEIDNTDINENTDGYINQIKQKIDLLKWVLEIK